MNNSLFVAQIFSSNLFIFLLKKKHKFLLNFLHIIHLFPLKFNPMSPKIMWNYENTLLGQLTSRE
jgi:hypothetical protein